MKAMKDLLQQEKSAQPLVLDEKTVFFLLRRIIRRKYGERGGEMIRPLSFKNKTLSLKTGSPLWANELWLSKKELLDELKIELGDEAVLELKFHP